MSAHRRQTKTYPPLISQHPRIDFVSKGPISRPDHRVAIERTNSISMVTGPVRVNPSVKLPGDFRTLSIHVTDTKEGRIDPKAKKDITNISLLEWHAHSVQEVCTRLGVSDKLGLDVNMAARRLAEHGRNVISRPPRWHLATKVFFYIFGGFGSLFFVASIICFLAWRPFGDPDPSTQNLALLLIVIALQAFLNAWQDYTTGRLMASIFSMLPTEILVTRSGETFKLASADLVVGDLVKITLGSKVPADLRLVDVSSDLRFDRSMLTGENNTVPATVDATDHNFMESGNIALQGTLCASGSGIGICVGLGDNTMFGRIVKQATSKRPAPTSLEVAIFRLVLIIASMALAVAILSVILWAAWLNRYHHGFITIPEDF